MILDGCVNYNDLVHYWSNIIIANDVKINDSSNAI